MKTETIDLTKFPGFDPEFAPPAGGTYVPVNVRANIAYVAIQFPIDRTGFLFQGILGSDLTTDHGCRAAARAALNVLGQIHQYVGFEHIEGLNHIDIYYRCAADWDEAPLVANAASEVFIKALGTKGIHSRALFGVQALPRSFSVGITASFTLS